jgi:hypothetical protein
MRIHNMGQGLSLRRTIDRDVIMWKFQLRLMIPVLTFNAVSIWTVDSDTLM